ncbi:MAG: rhamnulokinase family protein [bacterium]
MSTARKTYLAVDLGASGGRVMAGHFDGARLEIEEGARFSNAGLQAADGWHWDAEGLFQEITKGLAAAAARYGSDIVSIAVDTWGVDYALVGADGRAVNEPWMYRDSRTDGLIAEAARLAGADKIWSRTGIQPLFFNTIYQLMAESRLTPQALNQAHGLLFTPDYLNHRLCRVQAIERTIASTSGLLRAGTAEWDVELAETLGIPARILGNVTEPGVILGELTPALASATGLRGVKVTTCGSHDTASAVAGVPSRANPLFLSSGTWSLLGIELPAPVLSQEAFDAKFSNEQGLEGTTRFLTNISGMWLLQECRRVWAEAGDLIEYGEMVELARHANAPAIIDPDAPEFGKPCDMPQAILDWIKKTNQPAPASKAELIRVILESLAIKYGLMIERLRGMIPNLPDTLQVVGGGCKNALLNQMTADATGLRVEAGPVEATASGNIIAQLLANGEINSLAEGREILRNSCSPQIHEPAPGVSFSGKFARFLQIQSALS